MNELMAENSTGLVLVAAGSGSRFGGDVPKQFRSLDGIPVYLASLLKFLPFTGVAVILVPEDRVEMAIGQVHGFREIMDSEIDILVTAGGRTRQESVLKGLRCLQGKCRYVLVHDAVRPYLSGSLIARVIGAMQEYGAALPLEQVTDTVKVVKDGMVVETLDRSLLWRAQTPQGAVLQHLLDASEQASADGFTGTDESCLLEREGIPVRAVEGEKSNIKITWEDDLNRRVQDET
jgi:2-C-methyl-D-erythritol 4-phosphate cytidylyltransferase